MTKVTITLNQWENLSIQAYVREAEQMSKRTPENKDLMLAVAIIRDDIRRHEVSFAIRDRKVTFKDVIDLTKAADRSVGDSDPFGVGEDKTQHNHRQYLYLSSVLRHATAFEHHNGRPSPAGQSCSARLDRRTSTSLERRTDEHVPRTVQQIPRAVHGGTRDPDV